MPDIVQLKKILEALEFQLDDYSSYLDLDSGEVETLPDELVGAAEEAGEDAEAPPEDLLIDYSGEDWEAARRVALSDRFVLLPTKFDVHEWSIMQDFANAQDDQRIRDELLHALHGAGAFRHFKAGVQRNEVETAWYDFRNQALRQIAIAWCAENDIDWE